MLPKYRKYNLLQRKEKFLFLEALVLHLWVGLLLKVIPFRWIPRLFSSSKSTLNRKSQIANRKSQVSELEQIKIAIQRTSPYSPWRNKCLVSSLAARRMLSRRKIPSRLSLGVAKSTDGRTIAHAWLQAAEVYIVDKGEEYRSLYFF